MVEINPREAAATWSSFLIYYTYLIAQKLTDTDFRPKIRINLRRGPRGIMDFGREKAVWACPKMADLQVEVKGGSHVCIMWLNRDRGNLQIFPLKLTSYYCPQVITAWPGCDYNWP